MHAAVGEDDPILAAPLGHRLGRPPDPLLVVFKIVGVYPFAKTPSIGIHGFRCNLVEPERGIAGIRIMGRAVEALMVFKYHAGQLRGKQAQAVVALLGARFEFAQSKAVPDEARGKQQDENDERGNDGDFPRYFVQMSLRSKAGAVSNGGRRSAMSTSVTGW